VETFVAVKLMADTWRWAGVPILIRAGKCLPVTATEVTVRFRHPPRDIFSLAPLPAENELRFRVWPETAVTLTLAGKKPGAGWEPQVDELTARGTWGPAEADRLLPHRDSWHDPAG
jgi:glucose-6-phosphate 1-dehydrogenase